MKQALAALATTFVVSAAMAQSSPAGLWKTIDDATHTEKSLVRISEANGAFSGRIEKFLDPKAKLDEVCDKCADERKGKPILGMTIITGIKKNADSEGLWDGGTILDPLNGKTYKLRLKPVDEGKKLEVRGYIGMPLFGRSQTWVRAE